MRESLGAEAPEQRPGRRERVRYAKGRFGNLAAMLGLTGVPAAAPRDRGWATLRLDRMLARIAAYGPRPVVALLRFPETARRDLIDEAGDLLDYGIRTRDWIARWDAFTFLIVLDARIDHAIGALERSRDRIAALFDEAGSHDGVQIGIALSRRDETARDVVERARLALQQTPPRSKIEL